jgi:hypothetical protein
MESQLPNWEPTAAEVEQIIDELRPLIRGFAQRDDQVLAAGRLAPLPCAAAGPLSPTGRLSPTGTTG